MAPDRQIPCPKIQSRSYHDDSLNPSRVVSAIPTSQTVNHVQNILNIHCAAFAHGANRKSVTTVAILIAEVDVVRWGTEHQAIISVEDDVILKYYIRALDIESYRIDPLRDRLPRAIE